MIKKNFFPTIIAMMFVVTFFLYAQDNKTDANVIKILEDYTKNCDKLKFLIQNSNSWEKAYFYEDEEKARNLVNYLDLVAILKIEGLEGFFIEKIEFTPYDELQHRVIPLEKEFPVYAILCKMNLTTIDPLVKFIKQNDYKDKQRSVALSVRCFVEIYEKGGFGKEMAKKRLELELEKATEPEKANINKALELIDSK